MRTTARDPTRNAGTVGSLVAPTRGAAALRCGRVSSPRPATLALRRRRRPALLALFGRHAGLVRAIFYWLGADLERIDDDVLRTFLLAEAHSSLPSAARARPWLGHLAWRVACSPARASDERPAARAPRLLPAADVLARFLAVHAAAPRSRAAFVLAELAGLGPVELATLLRTEIPQLRAELLRLRRALADDPEVAALGGPRPLLSASVAPFVDDPAWTRRHAALLAARLTPPAPGLRDILRRPAGIVGLGLAAVALLLLLRPAAPQPRPPAPRRAPPPALAAPTSTPAAAPPPPVPPDMSSPPAPARKLARARKPGARAAAREELAAREKLAQTRDPGAIIVELEMIGAGRKALARSPAQALAYADQHAKEYPDSQLTAQRAELRVRALCALGRRDEARAEAERRGPGKARDALREACGP